MAVRRKYRLYPATPHPALFFAVIVVTQLVINAPALAESKNWLPPGSSTEILDDPPPELIRVDTEKDRNWLYGRLLFRSPSLLGEKAVRIGLSCNSCHTNGHVNTSFYINGLSDRPGRIDVTTRFWQAELEDGIANPLDIPSLRGSADSPSFGTINVFPDLHAFTRHVIVTEFAGPEPDKETLAALASYMKSLDINSLVGATAAVDTSPDTFYLSLLHEPLKNRDLARLDKLVDLIRNEYGRRSSFPTAQTEAIRRTITGLRQLRKKAAANDFSSASTIYQELINAQ